MPDLLSSAVPTLTSTSASHRQYNGELLSQLSKYRTQGQQEAASHRPPTDSVRLDEHEVALQSEAGKWLADEQRIFDAMMSDGRRALVELRQKSAEYSQKTAQLLTDDSMRSTIQIELAGEQDAVISAIRERMRADVDWKHFRVTHSITDPPSYPPSLVFHYGVVAILGLIETAMNAFFYENAQGLLGGFAVALGVSAINIITAVVLGNGFRRTNLRSLAWRIVGWSCIAGFAIETLWCNAVFASFRSEYAQLADPNEYAQAAAAFRHAAAQAARIFVLDYSFADMTTFVLFCVGILLSMAAFRKGYSADDKYPGHSEKDRALKKAQAVEAAAKEKIRLRIRDLIQARRAEVQSAIHEPAQFISRSATRRQEIQNAASTLKNHAEAVQRDFKLVLEAYRGANIAVRATAPPAYFAQPAEAPIAVSAADSESLLQDFASFQEELIAARERQSVALNDLLKRLNDEGTVALGEIWKKFVADAELAAVESINREVQTIQRQAA